MAWCRKHLDPCKVQGQFVFTDFPRTSTGKIQNFALRALAREVAVRLAPIFESPGMILQVDAPRAK
jgi:acyl-coenzyme A synthetase/AMP-(fatty) acid ligase